MATEWYLMGSMPVYNSGYEKEEFDMYATDSFTEILETSPVSETIQIINHDLTIVSEIKSVVLNNVADSTAKSIERQLLVSIGTLNCGDYVSYENKIWLVTSFVGNNGIYEKAIVELCTYTIKFQSLDGTILSYPCITSGKSFSNDENQVITLPSNQKSVLLPYDENTKLLDTDKRLFVDRDNKKPYKIIGSPDNTTYNYGDKGLIYFVTEADVLQETDGTLPKDRPDLGICNYFEPTIQPEPTPSPSGYTLTIASSGDFNLGTTRTLTPTLKDDLGNTVSSWVAVWSVNYNGMNQSYFTITYVGNQCKVTISDEAYDVIDGVLDLTCTVSGDTISATYSGMITA